MVVIHQLAETLAHFDVTDLAHSVAANPALCKRVHVGGLVGCEHRSHTGVLENLFELCSELSIPVKNQKTLTLQEAIGAVGQVACDLGQHCRRFDSRPRDPS